MCTYGTSTIAFVIGGSLGLDKKLLSELLEYYEQVIEIDSQYKDSIIDDFYLTYQAMLLAKSIAESTNKDLSRVDYSPMLKKIYYFKGSM